MGELTKERRERLRRAASSGINIGGSIAIELLDALDAAEAEVARLRARRAAVCRTCDGDGHAWERNSEPDAMLPFVRGAKCSDCNGEGAVLVDAPDSTVPHNEERTA